MASQGTTTAVFRVEEKHGSPTIPVELDDGNLTRMDYDDDTTKELQVPLHPIPSMQGAFAESMFDASNASSPTTPDTTKENAASRRQKLLDQGITEDTHASKWRQKPGQRYHELWKLTAQISFGIYLLLNGIAKDEEQVLFILQGHVNQVDAFLETTLDDFDLAIKDIEERLKFLKMPLENIDLFDAMLENREFRLQIVTGNEWIEHVIHRSASAMNDALKDVKQGLDATKEFVIYLAEEKEDVDWTEARPDMRKVYDAMRGNADGWYNAYVSLQTKGNHLGEILVQLGSIVAEMDRRAGQVSRNTRFSIVPGSAPSVKTTSRPVSPPQKATSHHSRPSLASKSSSAAKDLPTDPSVITPAIRATLPAFQYVSDRERAPEPTVPEAPEPDSEAGIEPEVFRLEPRTYSPIPSSSPVRKPRPQVTPISAPAPEIPLSAAPKKRFSLKRKATAERLEAITQSISRPNQPQPAAIQPTIVEVRSSHPTRGPPDSAYGSGSDKIHSRSNVAPGCFEPQRTVSYHERTPSDYSRTVGSPHSQQYNNGYIPSPRSDQQHFHPVRASPHSPLQRPWTAAPTNLRSQTAMSTSKSTMSQMTTVTEGGTKVKKKRSGFGWLKKAFSLSEEEKQVFEEKRRAPLPKGHAVDRRPQFLDGRRLR